MRTHDIRAGTSEAATLEKITDLGPDGIFTEIVAFDKVEVGAAESAAFRGGAPEGRTAVFQAAKTKHRDLAKYVDAAAGLIGIRLHPMLVSRLLSEQRLAIRPGDSSPKMSIEWQITTTTIPNLVVDLGKAFSSNQKLTKLRDEDSVERAALLFPFLLRAWSSRDDSINRFLSMFIPLEVVLGGVTPPDQWTTSRDQVVEIVRREAGERAAELLFFVKQSPSLVDRFD
jgi:hypothetical protein